MICRDMLSRLNMFHNVKYDSSLMGNQAINISSSHCACSYFAKMVACHDLRS